MYTDFAEVYNRLQDIDYNSFVDYYERIFTKFGVEPKLILDLGCGTGNVTIPLSKRDYEMIGVDLSEEMLGIASDKARKAGADILFLNQDMTEFELYGTVDAAVCALDGVNYLTENGDLNKLFSLIHNYLNPGGIFIFDINSEYKLKNILDGSTYIYDTEDTFCAWSSEYSDDDKLCEFCLDFFIKDSGGLYRRGSELQYERAYSDGELRAEAAVCGLEVIGCFNDRSFDDTAYDSERIFYVLKKQ